MTLQADAIREHLYESLLDVAGQLVEIQREVVGGTSERDVCAVKAGTSSELTEAEAAYFTSESQDWLIKTSDYVIGGSVTLPAKRDRILWRDPTGAVQTYDVGVDGVERQYRYTDQTEQVLRIHTTQIS